MIREKKLKETAEKRIEQFQCCQVSWCKEEFIWLPVVQIVLQFKANKLIRIGIKIDVLVSPRRSLGIDSESSSDWDFSWLKTDMIRTDIFCDLNGGSEQWTLNTLSFFSSYKYTSIHFQHYTQIRLFKVFNARRLIFFTNKNY